MCRGFGDRVQREARAYNAAILYWERAYDELLPEGADPVTTIEEGNAELQLMVANAAYRKGQSATATRLPPSRRSRSRRPATSRC